MRFMKFARRNLPELLFIVLIVVALFVYFVVYMTPSRKAWYGEMRRQIVIFYQELITIGR